MVDKLDLSALGLNVKPKISGKKLRELAFERFSTIVEIDISAIRQYLSHFKDSDTQVFVDSVLKALTNICNLYIKDDDLLSAVNLFEDIIKLKKFSGILLESCEYILGNLYLFHGDKLGRTNSQKEEFFDKSVKYLSFSIMHKTALTDSCSYYLQKCLLSRKNTTIERAIKIHDEGHKKGVMFSTFGLAMLYFLRDKDFTDTIKAWKLYSITKNIPEYKDISLNCMKFLHDAIIQYQNDNNVDLSLDQADDEICEHVNIAKDNVVTSNENFSSKWNDPDSDSNPSDDVNLKEDFIKMKALADKGDAEAATIVAIYYLNGEPGVCKKNKTTCIKYLHIAIAGKSLDAMFILAQLYINESSSEKLQHEGLSLLEEAAELGHSNAMEALANYYCNEKEFPGMLDKGIEYANKAINAGNIAANDVLGSVYLQGRIGIPINEDLAAKHLEKVEFLHEDDVYYYLFLAQYYYVRAFQIASKDQSSKEEDNLELKYLKKTFRYTSKAAKLGSVEAQHLMGKLYVDGLGVEQSSSKAKYWFNKASENGSSDGVCALGLINYKGLEGIPNYELAFEYFCKAAQAKNEFAMMMVASCYRKGLGVDINCNKAIAIYNRLIKLNYDDALLELASMYYNGEHMKSDYCAAFELYNKFLSNNDRGDIWFILGSMYLKGLGTKADSKRAIECFAKAEQLGYAQTENSIESLLELDNDYTELYDDFDFLMH
jgi:uncharacterized protein